MTESPAIAVLPYRRKLGLWPARIALDSLHWPLGQPARLMGKTLGDLRSWDHLITYPTTTTDFNPMFGVAAQVTFMVVEPSVIHAKHLRLLSQTYRRFYRVLSYNEALLAAIPNGIFFPFGTTWVPEWRDLDIRKTHMTSLIASKNMSQDGHMFRHEMVDWVRAESLDVEVIGRGYKPFDVKSDGLAPYRFSVVIENTREQNYFTEKLIDSILCETVPIYWGCPNIDRFFDTSGMVICETKEQVRAAVRDASEALYHAKLPALKAIKTTAAGYQDLEARAAQAVLDSL